MGTSIRAFFGIDYGAAVLQLSTGLKVAVFYQTQDTLEAYKNLDTTPVSIGTQNNTTDVGVGAVGARLQACIGSDDVIRMVVRSDGDPASDVRYGTLTTPGGTPSWAWEQIYNWTNTVPTIHPFSIQVDQNDVPHVLGADNIKHHGTGYNQIVYTNRIGGTWASPTVINAAVDNNYSLSGHSLVVRDNNNAEAFYYRQTDSDLIFKSRAAGSWGSETVYAGTWSNLYANGGVAQNNTAGTIHRMHTPGVDIYRNNADTAQNQASGASTLPGVRPYIRNSNNVLYVPYQDSSTSYSLLSYNGTSWTSEGTLETGLTSPQGIEINWAYLVQRNTTAMDYLYEDNGTLYWNQFSYATAPTRRIMGGFTMNQNPMQL